MAKQEDISTPLQLRASNVVFRNKTHDGETAASVAVGDKVRRADGGWVVRFASNERTLYVPDSNVLFAELEG